MKKEKIYKALVKAKQFLEEKGYNVFVIVLQGSQNYELDLYTEEYTSDYDCKAFVLPSFQDIYFQKKVSKVYQVKDAETGLEQVEVKDLRNLIELIEKGNPSYLELLATKYFITQEKQTWEQKQALLPQILATRKSLILKALYGMAKEKEKALKHPYPSTLEKIERFGYDPKQLHHIVRLRLLGERIIFGNEFGMVPTEEEKEHLLLLKRGALGLLEAEKLARKEIQEISDLRDYVSHLPITSEPIKTLESIVVGVIKRNVAKELVKTEGYEMVGYKAPLESLAPGPKAFVKEHHQEITSDDMVEVLEVKYYQLMNYWKK